jgi:hypothetical protein
MDSRRHVIYYGTILQALGTVFRELCPDLYLARGRLLKSICDALGTYMFGKQGVSRKVSKNYVPDSPGPPSSLRILFPLSSSIY